MASVNPNSPVERNSASPQRVEDGRNKLTTQHVIIFLTVIFFIMLACLFSLDYPTPQTSNPATPQEEIPPTPCVWGLEPPSSSPTPSIIPVVPTAMNLDQATQDQTDAGIFTPILFPSNFYRQIVDIGPKTGLYATIAVNSEGNAMIAYFDDMTDRLKLAVQEREEWTINPIPTNYTGIYPDLKLDSRGDAHVSFYQPDSGSLVYGSLINGEWSYNIFPDSLNIGWAALALGKDDSPYIVFSDINQSNLRIAHFSGGSWISEDISPLVHSESEWGKGFAFVISPTGLLGVVFVDDIGLHYATQEPNEQWAIETVDLDARPGSSPVLAYKADQNPILAYADRASHCLKFAQRDEQGWQVSQVVSTPIRDLAIAVNAVGQAQVVYTEEDTHLLRYAEQNSAGWNVSLVDGVEALAQSPSLVLTETGSPRISYYSLASRRLQFAWIDNTSSSTNPTGGEYPMVISTHYHSGQTFITWDEQIQMEGEIYRIYRSDQPITAADRMGWAKLGETGKYSSRFFGNARHEASGDLQFNTRFSDHLVIEDRGQPLLEGQGLFVWTLSRDDFGGDGNGQGFYAVTVQEPGGQEMIVAASAFPVEEAVAAPLPIDISNLSRANPDQNGYSYIQYMDLRQWNPTFHSPNASNLYYGLDPADPNLPYVLTYAYDYQVFAPTAEMCNGQLPEQLPVLFFLHGWRDNRYDQYEINRFPFCAYIILPIDQSETWYFGFARYHDYRQNQIVDKNDMIVNYTEQRLLRMLYDLWRQPPGPGADLQRVYLVGHSMGGTGSLALAEHFPNVFAAAYSSQPITNFITAGETDMVWKDNTAIKWGAPDLNLPIYLDAPNGWAAPWQRYNGMSVWDWENLIDQPVARIEDDMALLSVDHGLIDDCIMFDTQAPPLYINLDASHRAWGGAIYNTTHLFSEFMALPPWMREITAPFYDLRVVRDETVPGITGLSGNPPLVSVTPVNFNDTILWSSSWQPWDGAPIDTENIWQISLCSVANSSYICGSGIPQTVNITPRRMQEFQVIAGQIYDWQLVDIATGQVIDANSTRAIYDGVLTIENVTIRPIGVRLRITPHIK